MSVIEGPAICVGDAIDTDVIAPGSAADFYGLTPEAENDLLCARAFSAMPEIRSRLSPGAILVAGANFGCGSHRERANRAIGALGIRAILAESVARIYFRNAIALGQICLEAPGVTRIARDGERLRIDLRSGVAEGRGGAIRFRALSPRMGDILAAGGMLGFIRQKLEGETL